MADSHQVAQIKGWQVYSGTMVRPGITRWKPVSPLYTVRSAAETYAELARKAGGRLIEVREEYCFEKEERK